VRGSELHIRAPRLRSQSPLPVQQSPPGATADAPLPTAPEQERFDRTALSAPIETVQDRYYLYCDLGCER